MSKPSKNGFNLEMKDNNHVINSLWIGRHYSSIELLTLHSFIGQGHRFKLWVYESPLTNLPAEIEICDAREILPASRIFSYKNKNEFGHGQGSVSGFSDLFRYKLLYEKGGWWVDMDVCCIQPLTVDQPWFFREHHELKVVGNVMKCPIQSGLMKYCFDRTSAEVDDENTDWHKPIQILNDGIEKFALDEFIVRGVSNRDWWSEVAVLFKKIKPLPVEWMFLHLMNEELRARGIDKEDIKIRSVIGDLLTAYGIVEEEKNGIKILLNTLKHSRFGVALK